MNQLLGEICGFIGGTIGIVVAIPQVLRIRKLGHAEGLALSPWLMMLFQFASWTAFGFKSSSPSIFICNLLTFVTTALVVAAIMGNSIRTWSIIIGIGIATTGFIFYSHPAIVDVVLVLTNAARLPQLIKTWRNRHTAKPSSVSISSLVVALVSMSFWMGYGFFNQSALVLTSTSVVMAMTLATAWLETSIAKRTEKSSTRL